MCASALPNAIAVMTPHSTPKAHPAVMTIHPAPSAFDRFSSTLATTPLPSKISTSVPASTPEGVLHPVQFPDKTGLSFFHPIKRPRHRLLPHVIHVFTLLGWQSGSPGLPDRPVAAQIGKITIVADSQPSRIHCAQRGGFQNRRTYHRTVEHVGLKLHQHLIDSHSAIGAQHIQTNTGILLHRLNHFAGLKRGSFQYSASEMRAVGVAREAKNGSARIRFPVRRKQP